MELEFYEGVQDTIEWEGITYFLNEYASAEDFGDDIELRDAFIGAQVALSNFEALLEARIRQNGGEAELNG